MESKNRRTVLAGAASCVAALAGCSSSQGGDDPTQTSSTTTTRKPTETTTKTTTETTTAEPKTIKAVFEGKGESLKEFEVENEGAVFLEVVSEPEISVDIVPKDEDGDRDHFELSGKVPSAKLHSHIQPGKYAFDIETEGSWRIAVEQHPVFSVDEVDIPQFPIEIEGDRRDIFGPYRFGGFLRTITEANDSLNVLFIDNHGEKVEQLVHDGNWIEGEKSHDPINLEGVYWIEGYMRLPSWEGVDQIDYSITIQQPD